jgi:hypothetical protein
MRRILIGFTVMAVGFPAFGSYLYSIPAPANSFGLLGGSISNSGTSIVAGNVGATSTITGFPPGTSTGFACTPTSGAPCTAGDNSEVMTAYGDIFNSGGAFSSAEALTPTGSFTTALSQTFLGNTVSASSGTISTTAGANLTFDAQGNSTAVFVIQILGNLTVNGGMIFTLENGAQASNIFWIVEDAATISVGSSGPIVFDGNILSGSSFTMSAASGGSGALAGTINGCVFADTANTLAGETYVNGCSAGGVVSGVPEPGTAGLACLGGLLVAVVRLKLKSRLGAERRNISCAPAP